LVNARSALSEAFLAAPGTPPAEWAITDAPVGYEEAVAAMEERVSLIREGLAPERVWLLEHPPLYTAGTSAQEEDLVDPDRFPVYRSGRGGQFTYHGPGQRVAYVMLDLQRRTPDIRRYVAALEAWLIGTLGAFNIRGERREDRVGVWVRRPERVEGAEDKIAAIGIRVRRWVTFHGISLNIEPDLSHFSGIVPCGVRAHGVTSLVDLGIPVTMPEVDSVLRVEFERIFGPTALVL
jgi:lipoyl(octanoyl) transferase